MCGIICHSFCIIENVLNKSYHWLLNTNICKELKKVANTWVAKMVHHRMLVRSYVCVCAVQKQVFCYTIIINTTLDGEEAHIRAETKAYLYYTHFHTYTRLNTVIILRLRHGNNMLIIAIKFFGWKTDIFFYI